MLKRYCIPLFIFCYSLTQAQTITKNSNEVQQDSIKRKGFIKQLGNGFFPTRYINIDLRYLMKYNQYEGVRTGLGGITNQSFSKKYHINSYVVYGFRDHRFKYNIGGGVIISKKTNTTLNINYTDDLQETGSTKFLTDKRLFNLFEPRLLNIDLFHKHITKSVVLAHQLTPKLLTETELSTSKIDPTYAYGFNTGNSTYKNFDISTAKVALQWNPFDVLKTPNTAYKSGFPKFTFQYTKNFKGILKGDFNFSKIDFRTIYKIGNQKDAFSIITLVSGITHGNTPLTHLYHAYPNNINKETILQRFSVAGLNSFETMFFNEFFSDKFATFQIKHVFKPFKISENYKPQLALISRYAIGGIKNPEKHQNVTFGSLNKGYTESGFEINKLLYGFGLSFTYRYGSYHLPHLEDNIALKFTFNVSL